MNAEQQAAVDRLSNPSDAESDLMALGHLQTAVDIQTLLSLITELEADRKRLDWIEENCAYSGGGNGGDYGFSSPLDTECFRDAVDAAMKVTI